MSVHPSSREAADTIFGVLAESADVEMPLADQAGGHYYGAVKDRFGVQWIVSYSPPPEA